MKKIQTLDSLRLIMIFTIILSHMEFLGDSENSVNTYDLYFHNAYLGVNYFFLLSGFGLTLSYLRRNKIPAISGIYSIKEIFCFAGRRVKNIIPLYAITMIAMVPYEIAHLSAGGGYSTYSKSWNMFHLTPIRNRNQRR